MSEHPLNESLWRRGWRDTKAGWTSWKFVILDAVVGVVIGGVFGWYWGLGIVAFGMLCVWIGATAGALIKQRDEARALLQAKPKPIPISNRDELFRAISEVQLASGELLMAQERLDYLVAKSPKLVHEDVVNIRDDAHARYEQAMNKLNAEEMVAGEPFKSILSELIGYISTQVWMKEAKPTIIGGDPQQFRIRTALEIFGRIAGRVSEVTRRIDELSGRVPHKEGYQN